MARILIIDDDAPYRDVMAQLLRLHDHDVAEAADGDEGLRRQAVIRADVVLCDLRMPRMSGAEVIQAIRALTPRARIIAITGLAGYCEPWSTGISGADQTLSKPCPYEDLIAAIENPEPVAA